jgi:hypothetical protein
MTTPDPEELALAEEAWDRVHVKEARKKLFRIPRPSEPVPRLATPPGDDDGIERGDFPDFTEDELAILDQVWDEIRSEERRQEVASGPPSRCSARSRDSPAHRRAGHTERILQ